MPALLTVYEVADLLGCSAKTVRRMIARGDLPAVRLSARAVRLRQEDVERLVLERLGVASTAGTVWAGCPIDPPGSRWWEG